jgi:phage shock protein B
LSGDDEKTLGDLWQSARRMEGRIEALEKVLDSDAPGWRMRAGE